MPISSTGVSQRYCGLACEACLVVSKWHFKLKCVFILFLFHWALPGLWEMRFFTSHPHETRWLPENLAFWSFKAKKSFFQTEFRQLSQKKRCKAWAPLSKCFLFNQGCLPWGCDLGGRCSNTSGIVSGATGAEGPQTLLAEALPCPARVFLPAALPWSGCCGQNIVYSRLHSGPVSQATELRGWGLEGDSGPWGMHPCEWINVLEGMG